MQNSTPLANNLEKQVESATEENNTATEEIRKLLAAHIEKGNIEEYCKSQSDEELKELTTVQPMKGGDPTMISLDGIMIIILLLHGQIAINEAPINTSTLNVSNLASISTAPAGMVNIGTDYEIATHSKFLTKDLKKQIEDLVQQNIEGNLQKIENKANSAISAFSLVCDFCINLPDTIFGYLQSCVSSTASTIIGYTPKGILKICKSLTSTLTGGAGKRTAPTLITNPNAKRARNYYQMCSVSPDVCVSLLNSLRTSLKKFDADRFSSEICPPQIVSASPHLQDPYCSSAIANANDRYRHVHILKGFSADLTVTRLPLINKYLSFSTSNDAALNMGVTTLRFKIGLNNKVTCIPNTVLASTLMPNIKYVEMPDTRDKTGQGIIYYSTTQRLIEYCITNAKTPLETAIIVDLSCSSCPLPVSIPLDPYNTEPGKVYPGGDKRYINKRNKKFKVKTKKIKVKSLSKKNRRNVKILKRKTKKNKRTRRS